MGANSKGSRWGQGDIRNMYRHEVVLQCRLVGKSLQIRGVSKACYHDNHECCSFKLHLYGFVIFI